MLQNVTTYSQGTESWKMVTERMTISAYCPLYVEFGSSKPAGEVVSKEDNAPFGTHLREATRILRGR
jgi:hypothetical protein